MLIAQITALLISVLAPIALCIFKKYYKTPEYEICVTGGTNFILPTVLGGLCGDVFIVFSILSNSSLSASIFFFVLGMISIVASILGFYNALFDYTAFRDDTIIYKRLLTTKKLHISKIDKIDCPRGDYIRFYKKSDKNKYYKIFFEVDASAIDATELVHKIDERQIALNIKQPETNE